ncbi:hypothetical protein AWJ20_2062 [Sugiyamaella lignohabitans]|uniref:Uncharacterized protein n=1 Tax=Sugiyamaella lignohabitans TaxID=796027 RepID=A0A167EUF3_9ASCO|nr:uncharacterized protein AWJ20_2062 [Sugiyamaella lignohabitans]ANB14471.1 hypothetical protein AWJ20_2062 [Sugiyamaella lignohabitans]
MVSISSKECPNLKTALKLIVARLTESQSAQGGSAAEDNVADEEKDEDLEGEDVPMGANDIRYDRRLRYDLDILAQWCNKQVRSEAVTSLDQLRIVISIQDADSFQVSILTGLIEMMQSYITTIPLKLMLNVATSLEVFQEKLPRKCIRLLRGKAFQAQMAEGIMKILRETLFKYDESTLLLSPDLFNSLVHRQKQSLESVDTFISSLKYIFMAHYYSNPFSVLTTGNEHVNGFITSQHLRALRMLPSFKTFVERKLEQGSYSEAAKLLEDDDYLKSLISISIEEFREYARNVLSSIEIIIQLEQSLGYEESCEFRNTMDLYPAALSGELINLPKGRRGTTFIDSLISKVRKLDDESEMPFIVDQLETICHDDKSGVAWDIYSRFQEKCHSALDASQPLNMANIFADTLETHFKFALVSYKEMFLYEVLLSDLFTLQENVFLPTYRGALELGLSNPKHYWGDVTESTAQAPHISVLYQLYRESSVFINIFDYYSVFKGLIHRPDNLADDEWDRKSLAWFLQGIAELKFIGIIRDSKRKFECVEKIAWKDL